ncbi:ERF family protein [Dethiothermospora halolimnae]|uniref:ERF family protein n=1 Tax=Dethiothermospora halolimnae TaxID=3114390 RepID=UPI003CCBEF98
MSIHEKLMNIQSELKAPKNQYNSFGKYKYRSCEDILEGVKPLLLKNELTLTITDEPLMLGDRFYIKAIATLTDTGGKEKIEVSAFAREDEKKKGMDLAQVTGSTSSYARKYALNGLFCIDDTKDSDATNEHDKDDNKPSKNNGNGSSGRDKKIKEVYSLAKELVGYDKKTMDSKIKERYGATEVMYLKNKQLDEVLKEWQEFKAKKAK